MSVPKFFEFFEALLQSLQDGEIHTTDEVRSSIKGSMHLTKDDLTEMLPSRKQSTFHNRVAWARTYLDRAGLIETPSRGHYRITDEGLKALNSGKTIDLHYLDQFESFKEFHKYDPDSTKKNFKDDTDDQSESPEEILDSAYKQINDSLAGQLMTEVLKLDPSGFEKLVVQLLLYMGYGSGIEEAGFVTQQSNDGGIDGIIKEDQLGFSNIYIQAKQWALNRTVDKPEIQKFVGALNGQQAQKGLFITTAKFTSGAVKYSENLLGTKVVLVDGDTLTRLMIKHNLGVSVEHIYEVKKLDSDYFTDEF